MPESDGATVTSIATAGSQLQQWPAPALLPLPYTPHPVCHYKFQ